MKYKPVRTISHKSSWETTIDWIMAPKDRKRSNARLFCVMHAQGKIDQWTPYHREKYKKGR